METYVCVICGTTALLQHRFGEAEELHQQTRKVHVKEEDPRDAAERVAYRDKNGFLYLPGAAITRLLRETGSAHKQRGSRRTMKYVVPAAILVPDEQIILRDTEGNPLSHFEVDSRPVVIPSTKGRIMRHRPRINSWHIEFSIEIDTDMLDASLVHQLLSEGGVKLGLGDNRPEKGGGFGRFQVVSWAMLNQRTPLAEAAD